MNCLSLNIRGIRGSAKRKWVQGIKKEFNLGFMALQESMVEVVNIKDVSGLWGRTGLEFEFVPAEGQSGGLVSLWDPAIFQAKEAVKDRNFLLIIGKIHGCDEEVLIMNVYAPQDHRDKRLLWDKIRQVIGSKTWMLDFTRRFQRSEGAIRETKFRV